jgi:nucleolin
MNGSDLDGRSIRVDISAPRAPREVKPLNPESEIVYVGNLPFEADETSIQDALSQFGSINDIRLISDRETGESRGFGYVTFKDISAAKAAVAAGTGEGIQVDGRALRLDFSKPQNDRPSSGGRERSSFGGSSYGGRDGGSRQGGYRSDRDGGRPPMRGYGNGNGRDNSRGGGARGGGRSRRDDGTSILRE